MKIKEVREPKNKEELREELKTRRTNLVIRRLSVCLGAPAYLGILGLSIQDFGLNKPLFAFALFMLSSTIGMHYRNLDDGLKIARIEDQLAEVEEEQEEIEEYTRSLSR